MKIVIILLLLSSYIFSTTITKYNIYKQDDSVDLMLTFNEPYLGKISKKKDDNSLILMLENLNIEEATTEDIESDIVQKIQMLPYKKEVFIKVDSKEPYKLEASKTVDNYGLRIRIKPDILKPLQPLKLETKKEQDLSGSFLKVIAVLSLLALLLYLLKKWLLKTDQTPNNWLFHKDPSKKQNIKILHQKALDPKNRVALIEYKGIDYLVILGNNNIILDKFKSDEKDKDKVFENILNQNGRKLDALLKV